MLRIILALLAFILPALAAAQDYPAKPIRFVVPWPPSGLSDVVARVFNERVSKALGQTVVNDSRPGAGGRIGVTEVARAAPDGYTIGMGNLAPLTIYPHLYRDLPYEVQRDLVPITMFAASPLVLVIPNDLSVRSVKELIAMAKAQPGKLNYASVGVGSSQHLIFEMFKEKDGIDMVHVPYKGTSESLPALITGQVHAMFETLPSALPHIKSGRMRALAVTTPQRVEHLPEVPTLAQVGYPEVDVATWYALIAPAGTPKAIIDRLYKEYTAVAQSAEMQKFLAQQGLIYLPNSPGQFARRIQAETARWGKIIREQNIKVQ